MERGRAMFIRFLFHRRSGQQEERTTGGADSRSIGQRGVQREERTATMVDTKKGSMYI